MVAKQILIEQIKQLILKAQDIVVYNRKIGTEDRILEALIINMENQLIELKKNVPNNQSVNVKVA